MFNLLSVYIYLPVIYIHICTCGRRRKYIIDFELKGKTYFKFFSSDNPNLPVIKIQLIV